MLKMIKPNFRFYEDQKKTRVQYCTLKQIPSASSFLKFKNGVMHSLVSDALSMEVADFTNSTMESCAESNANIDFVPSEDILQN